MAPAGAEKIAGGCVGNEWLRRAALLLKGELAANLYPAALRGTRISGAREQGCPGSTPSSLRTWRSLKTSEGQTADTSVCHTPVFAGVAVDLSVAQRSWRRSHSALLTFIQNKYFNNRTNISTGFHPAGFWGFVWGGVLVQL